MPLPRDEVYRLIAVAKGDIRASPEQQQTARAGFRELLNRWTEELQRAAPGDLTITHDSVREAVEAAYRQYRQRRERAAARRRLQDKD